MIQDTITVSKCLNYIYIYMIQDTITVSMCLN